MRANRLPSLAIQAAPHDTCRLAIKRNTGGPIGSTRRRNKAHAYGTHTHTTRNGVNAEEDVYYIVRVGETLITVCGAHPATNQNPASGALGALEYSAARARVPPHDPRQLHTNRYKEIAARLPTFLPSSYSPP